MPTNAKTPLFAGVIATIAVAVLATSPVTASAQPWGGGQYGMSPQQEEAGHPRVVQAIRNLQETYRMLEQAPDTFGGHKAEAMDSILRSIHQLKRALYYRLNMDDAHIDAMLPY